MQNNTGNNRQYHIHNYLLAQLLNLLIKVSRAYQCNIDKKNRL